MITADASFVELWLSGFPRETRRVYQRHVRGFFAFTAKPMSEVDARDIENFASSLSGAVATRSQCLAAVKSLFRHAHRARHVRANEADLVPLPARSSGTRRWLRQSEITRMLERETRPRNRCLIEMLYRSGLRGPEVCALTWEDLVTRPDGRTAAIVSRKGERRAVPLSDGAWRELVATRPAGAKPEDPVFVSRKHCALTSSAVWRIVRAAARRAGLRVNVSPQWLRNSHARGAIDAGCPVDTVARTLGHAGPAITARHAASRPGRDSVGFLEEHPQ